MPRMQRNKWRSGWCSISPGVIYLWPLDKQINSENRITVPLDAETRVSVSFLTEISVSQDLHTKNSNRLFHLTLLLQLFKLKQVRKYVGISAMPRKPRPFRFYSIICYISVQDSAVHGDRFVWDVQIGKRVVEFAHFDPLISRAFVTGSCY